MTQAMRQMPAMRMPDASDPAALFDGLSLFDLRSDITENGNAVEITVELPGMDVSDVHVAVEGGSIVVRGEKRCERKRRDDDVHHVERRYGHFTRSFPIPAAVDVDRVEAGFDKGILTIVMPKAAAAEREERPIEIKKAA
ncbi:MAG: Hsp20/alpha crystallin family protein [Geminicoccaceae bacterium]|nr:Hsp20/alpha crystallin family protein [Geminicoccaceae bacterium]